MSTLIKEKKQQLDAPINAANNEDQESVEIDSSDDESKYEQTPYRWIVLFLYMGLVLNNSMIPMTVSPVALNVATTYDVNIIWVHLCSFGFCLMYVPMNFAVIWMYKTFPRHQCLRVGAVLQLIGVWLRYMTVLTGDYWYILAGQFVVAIAQPMIMNAISIIANVWFGDKQRALATSLAGLSNPVGGLISLVTIGVVFSGYQHTMEETGVDDLPERLQTLLSVQGIIVTLSAVPFVFLIRERPDVFPSHAASLRPKTNIKVIPEMKAVLQDKNYRVILVVFSLLFGVYTTLGNILSPVFQPYGYTPSQISIIGMSFILFGVAGSLLTGIMLDKTKKYLATLKLICIACTISLILALFSIPSQNLPLVLTNVAVMGFCMIPIMPCGFAFSVELTFPASPTIVNGLMLMSANVVAFIYSFFVAWIATLDPRWAVLTFAITCLIAVQFTFCIKEVLKRLNSRKFAEAAEAEEETKDDEAELKNDFQRVN